MGDMNSIVRVVLPIGRFFGRFPFVQFFTREELMRALRGAGFQIEEEWQPGKGKAVFVVARKPDLE